MMKNLALRQDVHRLGAERRLKTTRPKQCLAVLAQKAPDGKASQAGHKGCVNGPMARHTPKHSKASMAAFPVSNETAGLGQG